MNMCMLDTRTMESYQNIICNSMGAARGGDQSRQFFHQHANLNNTCVQCWFWTKMHKHWVSKHLRHILPRMLRWEGWGGGILGDVWVEKKPKPYLQVKADEGTKIIKILPSTSKCVIFRYLTHHFVANSINTVSLFKNLLNNNHRD